MLLNKPSDPFSRGRQASVMATYRKREGATGEIGKRPERGGLSGFPEKTSRWPLHVAISAFLRLRSKQDHHG